MSDKAQEDYNAKSDEELMEFYQMGNDLAFEILFHRHSGRVFGFLSKRLTKKKDADDLLQDVFLKLHRSKHLYNNTLPFSPWLFSITRSVLLDSVKKKQLEDPTEPANFDLLQVEKNQAEQNYDLDKIITSLPPQQQQVVNMRIYDEQTFEEIADRLSTSPENARQLFSRGIKKLRELIGLKEN
jgi:RNA polymerase sigma factor (sigma-70 family)